MEIFQEIFLFLPGFIVEKMLNPTLVVLIMKTSSDCIKGINYQEQASRGTNDFQQSLCLHFKSTLFFPNKSKSVLTAPSCMAWSESVS